MTHSPFFAVEAVTLVNQNTVGLVPASAWDPKREPPEIQKGSWFAKALIKIRTLRIEDNNDPTPALAQLELV